MQNSISLISVLPFLAALLAAFLAASTLRAVRRRSRTVTFFFWLNIATMLWSFFYALELNLDTTLVLDVAPIGSAEWIIYALQILGLAAAPTFWFLFTAGQAGKHHWLRGWRMLLAHVPIVYTVAIAWSNPLHHLFVGQEGPGAEVTYGVFAYPNQVVTFVLIIWGTYLLTRSLLRTEFTRNRIQAAGLFAAAFLPLAGGLAWALRFPLGLPIPANPVPILFPVLNAALLYQVLRRGLADIVPLAALQAFRTMADAVLVLSSRGTLVALNQAASGLLPEARTGQSLAQAAPIIARTLDGPLGKGVTYHEFEIVDEQAIYWGRLRQTLDSRDAQVGYIVILTDVTELRVAQSELVGLNVELEHRVAALDDANHRLEEATEAKTRFLANMSHELRTPLNSIIGFSGIMLQGLAGPITDEQHDQLAMVRNSGHRLLTLVNDILDISKIEAGKLRMRPEPTDIQALVQAALTQVEPHAKERGLELSLRAPEGDITVVTDGSRVQQVLVNLLTNAVKFTDDGSVTLELAPMGDTIEFRVVDTGVGIPPEALQEIFTEFSRVEPESSEELRPGVGLGLSICSRLAVMLGAELSVESQVGQGSTFTFSLPRG